MAGTQEGLQRDDFKTTSMFPLLSKIHPQPILAEHKTILPKDTRFNATVLPHVLFCYLRSMIICLSHKFSIQHVPGKGWLFLRHLSADSVAHHFLPFPQCVKLYTLLEHSMHFLLLIYHECIAT